MREKEGGFAVGLDDALVSSAEGGRASDVAVALERGANPNAKNWEGVPVLFSAIAKGDSMVVKALIGAGADVNGSGPSGLRPLHAAACAGMEGVVRDLTSAGADVNAKTTERGATPLMMAVLWERGGEVLEALLEAGADVNAKAFDGTTALMELAGAAFSAYGGDEEMVGLEDAFALLDAGADALAVSNEGKTAFDLALENGNARFAGGLRARLEQAGLEASTRVARAPSNGAWL